MFKSKSYYRFLSVLLAFTLLLSTAYISMITGVGLSVDVAIKDTLVNGDMESGSWYAWAGDNIVGNNLTGTELDNLVTSTERKHGGEKSMQFMRDWSSYPSTGTWAESETIAGCKTTIKEDLFNQIDLENMLFTAWILVDIDNAGLASNFFAFDVRYRAVNKDGTYGEEHTVSLLSQVTKGGEWVEVSAELANMTEECKNAKTIEFEIFTRSYCSLFIDDADVVCEKSNSDLISDSLVNGDMESGSWYAWAGVLEMGDSGLTGAQLDAEVSTTEVKHSGEKSMQFMRDWSSYPSTGEWGESETIIGCRTNIFESKFSQMDLSKLTFSIWAFVDNDQLFAFDIKYRAVNVDGTYGNYHTTSLLSKVTEYGKWVELSASLDNMTLECINAKTIEFEVFTRSYCRIYMDDADVTAPRVGLTDESNSSLVNGDMESGSWYAWAGNTVLGNNLTGIQLDASVSTDERYHGGKKAMKFTRDWDSYPSTGDWNESEMIAGCKTTIAENKFSEMDLSKLSFSMWIFADNSEIFAYDVKYRSVNNDGTFGEYHTVSLLSQVKEYGKWVKVEAKLDNMTVDCENAKTIEFELFTRSYCSIYLDDADVTWTKPGADTSESLLVNGDMEQGSWYEKADLANATVSTDMKHSGEKAMQFKRDWDSYPSTGDWNESEMIEGCKTTIKEDKFAEINLSRMTFSIWIFADNDQLFAFDVKYRAVYEDGTYGQEHIVSLLSKVTTYGDWVQASARLDNMTSDCENAKTIEFELFTRSYCSVYFDDADVTYVDASSGEQEYGENLVINGDAEQAIWGIDPTALRYPDDLTIVRDTEVKFSGEASARLESRNESGNASIHCQIIPFDAKKRYRIEMDVKTDFPNDGTGAHFGLLESFEGGNKWTTVMGEEALNRITETQDWTHFAINVSGFNPGTKTVVMYIHLNGIGTAWFDNITVTEIIPLPGVAGEVTADIPSGVVEPGQEVWLTTGSEEADIYYTIDGSDPSTSPTRYYYAGIPIIVTEDMTVKTVAVDERGPGKVASYDYTVERMLIANGGFEEGIWEGETLLECSVDTSVYHSGSKSLKIQSPYSDGNFGSEWVKLDTRYDYELSFWAKTEGFTSEESVFATIMVKDSYGNEGYYERTERLIPIPADSEWTEYKVYMNDLNYSQAQFYISADSDVGTVWIDDVKLLAKQDNTRPITVLPSKVDVFGNIYYNSLYDPLFKIEMGALLSNAANCEQKITIDYHIVNLQSNREYPGSTVENFIIPGKVKNAKYVEGGSDKLDLSSVGAYGVYKVVFTITDETGFTYEAGSFDVTRSNWEEGSTIDWFGLGSHELNSDAEERVELFRKLGVGAIRWGALWDSVEKTKGVYTFDPKSDELIKLMQSKGMHVILLIGEYNPIYCNGKRPTSDADLAAFAEYCKATVAHFKELGIKEYEMWNEYDYKAWLEGSPDSGATDYARMVKAAYPAMKQADPDCVVMNGCTSGVNYQFMKKLMDEGCYEYTDAISLHPYCYQAEYGRTPESGGFIERCKAVYDMANSYGNTRDIKIWITEFGFQTAQDFHGQTEAEAAMNTIRSLALASANLDFIEKVYVYEEYDRLGINVRDGEHHFGINHGTSYPIPYSAKMVMPAMSAFATRLAGATYKTTHQYGNSLIAMNYGAVINHEYVYEDGRKLFALYDMDNIGRKFEVTLKTDDVYLYDMYGNPIGADVESDGKLLLELDGNMVYMVLGQSNDMISAELISTVNSDEDDFYTDDSDDSEEITDDFDDVRVEDSVDDEKASEETTTSGGGKTVLRKVRRYYYGTPWWVYVVIAAVAVVVVGGVITFIVLFRRKKRNKSSK